MNSRAERLDEILMILRDECVSDHDWKDWSDLSKRRILDLFMECVPEKAEYEMDLIDGGYDEEDVLHEKNGFNNCRAETLKNIEEIRK